MAHANFADCPYSGAPTALSSAFETSPNPNRGEVSKSPLGGKRRGGARNRADRASDRLRADKIADLYAAASMAGLLGLPLNRFITVNWEAAGVSLEGMAKATGRLIDQMTKTLRRRGSKTAWIWVHENGVGMGGHCHLVIHVPPECVPDLTGAMKRWLRKITGKPYRDKTIKSRIIGGRLGLEVSNPELHIANLETVLAYVTKQADALATSRFHQEGGRVIGRRSSTSQNIAVTARGLTSGK